MAGTTPQTGGCVHAEPDNRDERGLWRAADHDLLRVVSHDLRAPLRHVTAFAPLLRELIDIPEFPVQKRSEALEFLQTMEHAGQRMTLMLDATLAVYRVATASLRVESVDLRKLIQPLIDQVSATAPTRSVEWRIGGLACVCADIALLRPALLALISNAWKFTKNTEQALVHLSASQDPDGQYRLCVQDNGAGFDMLHSQGLFDLFQRLHPEREFKGVGAGLALVRAVAQKHGGAVRAHASVGAGCCVEMVWPPRC